MNRKLLTFSLLISSFMNTSFAAKPLDLKHQSPTILNSYLAIGKSPTFLKQVNKQIDFNETTHIRLKEYYQDVPVWGGDVVIHIPKGNTLASSTKSKSTMNGIIYQELNKDLDKKPLPSTADSALKRAITIYQDKYGKVTFINPKNELMIFVDKNQKAHWTYLIEFLATNKIARPTFIIDANTFEIYHQWDNIQTLEDSFAGGFGGNIKMGKLIYDGIADHLPQLNIERDVDKNICYLQNTEVTVKNALNNDEIVHFDCGVLDIKHNNVYWNGSHDSVSGAFSPSNDALYIGRVVQDMYLKWYGIPALIDTQGYKMMLNMRVHVPDPDNPRQPYDNAFWDGEKMNFGDGRFYFYPLTSLGVGAHEISHGFTEQHSNLTYWFQPSGGLNESFSDMAAQAVEYFTFGKNTWQIGQEILKGDGSLRYMDKPSKDCNGRQPGQACSIDSFDQYWNGLDMHYSSGLFNRAFYIMATSAGWDTKKAFDVMVQANRFYWTANISFTDAACNVLQATKDFQYDLSAVKRAFSIKEGVGIDTTSC